jgi:hypothetical protein
MNTVFCVGEGAEFPSREFSIDQNGRLYHNIVPPHYVATGELVNQGDIIPVAAFLPQQLLEQAYVIINAMTTEELQSFILEHSSDTQTDVDDETDE